MIPRFAMCLVAFFNGHNAWIEVKDGPCYCFINENEQHYLGFYERTYNPCNGSFDLEGPCSLAICYANDSLYVQFAPKIYVLNMDDGTWNRDNEHRRWNLWGK